MIKKFSGYDEIEIYEGGGVALEPGGYELMILGAKVETYTSCSILKIMFDIVDHEVYTKIFSERYKAAKAQNPGAKWPSGGTFDVFIPKDDGTEMDGYTKQAFKRFITSVEKSSGGYIWNWDETTLKGKFFGGVFGREEFKTKNGDYKFATKCRFARSVESIRNHDYSIPEDKLCKERKSNPPLIDEPYTADVNNIGAAYNGDLSDFETILGNGVVPF